MAPYRHLRGTRFLPLSLGFLAVCGLAAQAAILSVGPGGNLQAALDGAQPGDTIVLQGGASYVGNFVLPVKTGASYITIRTSLISTLPTSSRISKLSAPVLPKLLTPNTAPALATASGAHHWRIVGLEIAPVSGQWVYDVVRFGATENSDSQLPHDLILDRVYVHGDPVVGSKRGVALNSKSTTVQNCYISDFKTAGQDTQAVGGWNGPGPYVITNNYLEAAGENILFGGAPPSLTGVVPSDIVIRGNYLYKQPTWRGSSWTVKNLLELKNARRVVIDGNVLENVWTNGQDGFAVLFTVRTEQGAASWAVVEDVSFTRNLVRGVEAGVNILGTDDNGLGKTRRVLVRDNVFDNMASVYWGDFAQVLNGAEDVTIDHNTAFEGGSTLLLDGSLPQVRFAFRNNIAALNDYGVAGTGTLGWDGTSARYAPDGVMANNILVNTRHLGSLSGYPASTYFPDSFDAVGFVSLATGDYRLSTSSTFRSLAAGIPDIGADAAALQQATAGVIQ